MLSPMKPQTTDRVAARSSTSTFSVSRVLPVANSMKIAARGEGHCDEHREARDAGGSHHQSQSAELGLGLGDQAPVRRGEEVAEVELRHEAEAFPGDEHEDRDHEHDRRDAPEEDQPLGTRSHT